MLLVPEDVERAYMRVVVPEDVERAYMRVVVPEDVERALPPSCGSTALTFL
jgi:hypothetical protein